jgi:predicted aconitase with swiveling domain
MNTMFGLPVSATRGRGSSAIVAAEASKIVMRSGLIACIVILLPVISNLGARQRAREKGTKVLRLIAR